MKEIRTCKYLGNVVTQDGKRGNEIRSWNGIEEYDFPSKVTEKYAFLGKGTEKYAFLSKGIEKYAFLSKAIKIYDFLSNGI